VPVAELALSKLSRAVDAVIVAVRRDDAAIAGAARSLGMKVVVPDHATLGMGHSLAAGACTAVQLFPDARWLVVALADMPWVKGETVQILVDAARASDRITQPVCAGRGGHPVVFPVRYVPELSNCTGDTGARGVMQRHAADVLHLDVEDTGVLRDVDSPADLAQEPQQN
jgi:molybdenum cofactor cytidylyltransferase